VDEEQGKPEDSSADDSPESTTSSTPPPMPTPPPMQTAPPQVVYQYPPAQPTNGLAVAALVVGIVGLVLFWTVWGGVILGILGLVFGAVGLNKSNRGAPNKGMAVAGLTLGGIALVGSILFAVALVSVVGNSEEKFDQIAECIANDNC
jgi:hypothetical protein